MEETLESPKKATISLSAEPSYPTMRWLRVSLQIQLRSYFTQKEMSISTTIRNNEFRRPRQPSAKHIFTDTLSIVLRISQASLFRFAGRSKHFNVKIQRLSEQKLISLLVRRAKHIVTDTVILGLYMSQNSLFEFAGRSRHFNVKIQRLSAQKLTSLLAQRAKLIVTDTLSIGLNVDPHCGVYFPTYYPKEWHESISPPLAMC